MGGGRWNGMSGETFVRCDQYESCPSRDPQRESRSERGPNGPNLWLWSKCRSKPKCKIQKSPKICNNPTRTWTARCTASAVKLNLKELKLPVWESKHTGSESRVSHIMSIFQVKLIEAVPGEFNNLAPRRSITEVFFFFFTCVLRN